eukprot:s8257_g2.t1
MMPVRAARLLQLSDLNLDASVADERRMEAKSKLSPQRRLVIVGVEAAAGAIDEGWAVRTKWHDMLTAASKRSSFRGVAARLADPCVANAHLALLQARVAANPETQRKCPTLVSVRPSRRCMADGSAN